MIELSFFVFVILLAFAIGLAAVFDARRRARRRLAEAAAQSQELSA